jgi:hypothetical protein
MAIFFSLLPLSFIVDEEHGFRFLFAQVPVVMAAMILAAVVFWVMTLRFNQRWSKP